MKKLRWEQQNPKAAAIIGFSMIACFIAFAILIVSNDDTPKPAKNQHNIGWAQLHVKRHLNAHLNDADSYESMEWSKLTPSGSEFVVRHKYRAANGFGAKIIQNQIFSLDSAGRVTGVLDYGQ